MDAVLLDTCVLLKSYLCDTLLSIAEEGVYLPSSTAWPRWRPTENLKDFPPGAVAHLGMTVAGQDDFLSGLLELYPDAVLDALRRQASRYRREPRTLMALLNVLASPGQGCPEFTRQCRTLL
jgi:hypothetical protein